MMYYSPYSSQQRALIDFNRLHSQGVRHRMMNTLFGKDTSLLNFDAIRERYELRAQHDAGMQTVLLENVIGTVGRTHDFDNAFYPKQETTRHRWIQVASAIYDGREMPSVELYRVHDAYYVIDGNHRISVWKAMAQEFIEAHVIDVELGEVRCQTEQIRPQER
ncbi:MAG: hypothetical protein ACFE0Q_07860 [Anaerolineae bacterium]